MYDMEEYRKELEARSFVERKDEWLKWMNEIPAINFKSDWLVTVIPPFGGAIARFLVAHKDNPNETISVYLDCYGRLGCMNQPYWEMYPRTYEGYEDTERFYIEEVEELVGAIDDQLKIMNK